MERDICQNIELITFLFMRKFALYFDDNRSQLKGSFVQLRNSIMSCPQLRRKEKFQLKVKVTVNLFLIGNFESGECVSRCGRKSSWGSFLVAKVFDRVELVLKCRFIYVKGLVHGLLPRST